MIMRPEPGAALVAAAYFYSLVQSAASIEILQLSQRRGSIERRPYRLQGNRVKKFSTNRLSAESVEIH
jgi:hypothetical protein